MVIVMLFSIDNLNSSHVLCNFCLFPSVDAYISFFNSFLSEELMLLNFSEPVSVSSNIDCIVPAPSLLTVVTVQNDDVLFPRLMLLDSLIDADPKRLALIVGLNMN